MLARDSGVACIGFGLVKESKPIHPAYKGQPVGVMTTERVDGDWALMSTQMAGSSVYVILHRGRVHAQGTFELMQSIYQRRK